MTHCSHCLRLEVTEGCSRRNW